MLRDKPTGAFDHVGRTYHPRVSKRNILKARLFGLEKVLNKLGYYPMFENQ